jgi:hypothetical protein
LLARKAVRESYSPSSEVLALMRSFKEMTNACIRIGLADDASTRMRLTYLAYHGLAKFDVPSYCKVCAISKAAGIPVIQLTKSETRGMSSYCYRCGERLQGAGGNDVQHRRELWCPKCAKWFDRDLVAVMNISYKGSMRFAHSKGEAIEAMRGNQTMPVILSRCLEGKQRPMTSQNSARTRTCTGLFFSWR